MSFQWYVGCKFWIRDYLINVYYEKVEVYTRIAKPELYNEFNNQQSFTGRVARDRMT